MGASGRPLHSDQLTPETHAEIVKLIAAGDYLEGAAAKCNLTKVTVYAWLKKGARSKTGKHRDFLNAVNRAQDEADKIYLDVVDRAAFGTVTEEISGTLDAQGNPVGDRRFKRIKKIDWKAATWRLQHRRPSLYGLNDHAPILSREALDEFVAQLLQVIEARHGEAEAKAILEEIREQLPDDDSIDYFARSRLQIVYDDSNGSHGKTEVLADPYISALPASQQDLAGEVSGLGVRPPVGENPLGSGEGGTEMPNP